MENTSDSTTVTYEKAFGDNNRDATRTIEATLNREIPLFSFDCRYRIEPTNVLIDVLEPTGRIVAKGCIHYAPKVPLDASTIVTEVKKFLTAIITSPQKSVGTSGNA